MYIVTVTICKSGIFGEELTYRFKSELLLGDLVQVTFRKSLELAIVVQCLPLSAAKTLVKKSNFAVHVIESVIIRQYIQQSVIKGLEDFSLSYNISAAKVLASIVSVPMVKAQAKFYSSSVMPDQIRHPGVTPLTLDSGSQAGMTNARACISKSYLERINHYSQLILKQTSKVPAIILAPTEAHAEKICADLQSELENVNSPITCIVAAGKLPTKKELQKIQSDIQIVYCVTPHQLGCFLQTTPGLFICESENHPLYGLSHLPFIDYRLLCKSIAKNSDVPIIFGDAPCSTLALTNYLEHEHDKNITVVQSTAVLKTYARDATPAMPTAKKDFEVFIPELAAEISLAVKNNQSVFVVASRHGYAPSVICNDCSAVMRCQLCQGMLVLKNALKGGQSDTAKIYVCHDCKETCPAFDQCPACAGFTLKAMGMGVEKIAESLTSVISAEYVYVRTETSKLLKNMATGIAYTQEISGPAVCVGTVYDLDNQVKIFDHVVIVSHEGMLAAPLRNIFDYQEFLGKTVREHSKINMHVQVQHGRTDLRAYSGADFEKRLSLYLESARQYHLSPAISLALVISGYDSIKKTFVEKIKTFCDTHNLVLQNDQQGQLAYVPPTAYTSTCIIVGYKDINALIASINAISEAAQYCQALRVHYVPYPAQFKYTLRKW